MVSKTAMAMGLEVKVFMALSSMTISGTSTIHDRKNSRTALRGDFQCYVSDLT